MSRRMIPFTLLASGALVLALVVPASGNGTTTIRVSLASDGSEVARSSYQVAISADGSTVAFVSAAAHLVDGDTNQMTDVFVYTVATGETRRVSIRSNGTEGNEASGEASPPTLSADGRYVAFESRASNLVPRDRNRAEDVFVHDVLTGITTRVSVRSNGAEADGASWEPAISADGNLIAFTSGAEDLVARDRNDHDDVFVHDRATGRTTLVSVASDGTRGDAGSQTPSISANGRIVSFDSWATHLVRHDTNGLQDVFAHNLRTGRTTRVSVRSDGRQARGCGWITPEVSARCGYGSALSADGRFVVFASAAKTLVRHDTNGVFDVFVHDRTTHRTVRVNLKADGEPARRYGAGSSVDISADGRLVAFTTFDKLVPGDTNGQNDIYVRDRVAGATTRMSLTWQGEQADRGSGAVAMSDDGIFVAFVSGATNLAEMPDSNHDVDVYLRGPIVW